MRPDMTALTAVTSALLFLSSHAVPTDAPSSTEVLTSPSVNTGNPSTSMQPLTGHTRLADSPGRTDSEQTPITKSILPSESDVSAQPVESLEDVELDRARIIELLHAIGQDDGFQQNLDLSIDDDTFDELLSELNKTMAKVKQLSEQIAENAQRLGEEVKAVESAWQFHISNVLNHTTDA